MSEPEPHWVASQWIEPHWVKPEWPAPANISALITTRSGGASTGPWAANNLALHVGDDPAAVSANRRALMSRAGLTLEPQWLTQIHGVRVLTARADGQVRRADGCHTRQPGLACAVLTADCLPLLLCDRDGRQVAAVHSGWRGLARGILRRALTRFAADPSRILVYLGPAISQTHFEVGPEVRGAFLRHALDERHRRSILDAFVPASSARPDQQMADLYALARAELTSLGVTAIYGGDRCTYTEAEHFYSYRRDGNTGRFASLIWMS